VSNDPIVFIGPGSEWFWSMAQFVLVAGSILGIYVQLRAQRASALFDQTASLSREWIDESFIVHRLAALVALEDRPIEAGLPSAAMSVYEFFDRIGYLVAKKHIRAADVSETLGNQIIIWWALLGPYLRDPKVDGRPAHSWFEALASQMRTLNPDARNIPAVEVPARDLSEPINALTEELRRLVDARNGTFPRSVRSNENVGPQRRTTRG
jgi:hypothetical protein